MWLLCEVRLGPFADERMVRVTTDGSERLGFVNVRWLRNRGLENRDNVRARVVEVEGPTFPGSAIKSGWRAVAGMIFSISSDF